MPYLQAADPCPPKQHFVVHNHDGYERLAGQTGDKDLLHEHGLQIHIVQERAKHSLVRCRRQNIAPVAKDGESAIRIPLTNLSRHHPSISLTQRPGSGQDAPGLMPLAHARLQWVVEVAAHYAGSAYNHFSPARALPVLEAQLVNVLQRYLYMGNERREGTEGVFGVCLVCAW